MRKRTSEKRKTGEKNEGKNNSTRWEEKEWVVSKERRKRGKYGKFVRERKDES